MTLEYDAMDGPSDSEVRAALERLVSSDALSKCARLASFLRFVVEATLAGQGDRLKGYTIATGALGRDDNFDPQTDPIVRVEAGRLRHALEKYYANGGANKSVVIELPRGAYVPRFRRNVAPRRNLSSLIRWPARLSASVRDRFRLVLLIAGVSAAVSVGLDLAHHMLRGNGVTPAPIAASPSNFVAPLEMTASNPPSHPTN